MNIRNIRQLKQTADQRLRSAGEANRILWAYIGITVLISLFVTAVCYWLDTQISQQGGLSNLNTRTLLSTLNTVLPLISNLALVCLELGFLAAMLRIGRGQYASPKTLRSGMSRFWAMIRANLILTLIYMGAAMGSIYLAGAISTLLPSSQRAMALLESLSPAGPSAPVIDDALITELGYAALPAFALFIGIYMLFFIPLTYRYRMVNFLLMDHPRLGAMTAIHMSKLMMHRNRLALFRLDLSLWWYYLLSLLASCLCYGDMILPYLGISLPFSDTFSYFFFYILYLVALCVLYLCFRNRVGVIYALAYESLKPRESQSDGVVLGSIFRN